MGPDWYWAAQWWGKLSTFWPILLHVPAIWMQMPIQQNPFSLWTDTVSRSLLTILTLDVSSFTMWHTTLFSKWQTVYLDEFGKWQKRREGCKQLLFWFLNCLKVVCKNRLACKKWVPVVCWTCTEIISQLLGFWICKTLRLLDKYSS